MSPRCLEFARPRLVGRTSRCILPSRPMAIPTVCSRSGHERGRTSSIWARSSPIATAFLSKIRTKLYAEREKMSRDNEIAIVAVVHNCQPPVVEWRLIMYSVVPVRPSVSVYLCVIIFVSKTHPKLIYGSLQHS